MSCMSSRALLAAIALCSAVACDQPANDRVPIATESGAIPPLRDPGDLNVHPTNDVASLAISPDGRQLVFAAVFEGRNRLWLLDIATGAQTLLPGTEEGFYPFWSPDGRQIGFFGNDQLKRLDLASGATDVLVPVATWGAGGSWGPDGTILFATHGGFGIGSTQAPGTQATRLPTRMAASPSGPNQFSFSHPHFLPDGVSFLFYAQGMPAARGIYVGRLGSSATSRLVDSEAAGMFALGRLFFVSDGTLMAQPFDTVALALTGTPEAIAEGVPIGGRSAAALAASAMHIAYRSGDAGSVRQLTWFDRSGNVLGTVGEPVATGAGAPSISPDGRQVVINVLVDGLGDIWTMDLASGASASVADNAGNDSYPIWSYDSDSVLYSSAHIDFYPMYRKSVVDGTEATRMPGSAGLRHPMDWSRDGRFLVFRRNTPDLWVLDVASGEEIPVVPQNPPTRWPQISPDGRWIAYQSEISGQSEIHLHGPFEPPAVGRRSEPVSVGGGAWVRWRADGRELFYAAPDGTLMAVALEFSADGRSFTAAAPVPLFQVPMAGGPLNRGIAQQFMVADDGQRFLVLVAQPASSPVHLVGSN